MNIYSIYALSDLLRKPLVPEIVERYVLRRKREIIEVDRETKRERETRGGRDRKRERERERERERLERERGRERER